MLIAHAPGDAGFQRFAIRTFPEQAPQFEIDLRWSPNAGLTGRGRNVIDVYEAPGFAASCVDRATEVAQELLSSVELSVGDVDLVIASQYPRGFGRLVARQLGIPVERVPQVAAALATAHTAGPIAALETAIESRQFSRAHHTLFVTAGAGITIGAAVYRA
jgi:3-oxoacyl-[acyl-carrier-protein] synthase III